MSRDVGNVKNKDENLHAEVEIGKDGRATATNVKDEKSKSLMSNWLKKSSSTSSTSTGSLKRDPSDNDESENKDDAKTKKRRTE